MLQTLYECLKRQRLACSWAVIVASFLIVIGHAPIFPVIMGGLLAIGIAILRDSSFSKRNASSGVR